MIIEAGHFALILALVVAIYQIFVSAFGAFTRNEAMARSGNSAAFLQFALILIAFLALMHAYVVSDFSVANVFQNSHSTKPLLYKISGVWANHEGSMLLWVLILAAFGAAVALVGRNLPMDLKALVLAAQGSIGVAFITFIIATSNPFVRLEHPQLGGAGLNPVLQDPALAFHPPLLYGGYVGFSIAFSFSIAALLTGRIDAAWARWVRPWTLAAWVLLTLGISTGSWWAYYELGWGGFWFWDPVENASLMPWLSGTALLHSALVMEKRDSLKVWTVLLAILTFALSLMGTFLVRSGVLSSVHSFASDPARGTFVLAILALFTLTALGLFAWRAPMLRQGGVFAPISREGSLLLNNLLLMVGCWLVFMGTLYPLVYQFMTGGKLSVGAPFYAVTFMPLMIPLLAAVPYGPILAWKRGDIGAANRLLLPAAAIALLTGVLVLWRAGVGHMTLFPLSQFSFSILRVPVRLPDFSLPLAFIGVPLGVWIMMGALSEVAFRIKLAEASLQESWRRFTNLRGSQFGTTLAHFGVGLLVLGIAGTAGWRSEKVLSMSRGEFVDFAGFRLTFKQLSEQQGPNYIEREGVFRVERNGSPIVELAPSLRVYDTGRDMPTTEAAIYPSWSAAERLKESYGAAWQIKALADIATRGWAGDLYVTIRDPSETGAYSVHLYYNPLVRFIWLGALLMFFGGGVSLADRRLRVGAPRKIKTAVAPVAAE